MQELWCEVGEGVVVGELRLKVVSQANGAVSFGIPGTALLLGTIPDAPEASNTLLPAEER